jgi:hypothetical protein
LTEKQVISATAIKEALEGMAEQWLKTKEAIKESKQEEFMASMKIPEKWHDIAEAIDMFVSELDVSIEAKKGDFKDISKTSTDLKKRAKSSSRMLTRCSNQLRSSDEEPARRLCI